jgi:hypothetical protein
MLVQTAAQNRAASSRWGDVCGGCTFFLQSRVVTQAAGCRGGASVAELFLRRLIPTLVYLGIIDKRLGSGMGENLWPIRES